MGAVLGVDDPVGERVILRVEECGSRSVAAESLVVNVPELRPGKERPQTADAQRRKFWG